MRILLVENERATRLLRRVLTEAGYLVDTGSHGSEALERASAAGGAAYDLIVLASALPDVMGRDACAVLRSAGVVTPLLILGEDGSVGERVRCLEAGADAYLTKPVDRDEFLARARALLRRSAGFGGWRCGALELDRDNRRAVLGGEPLALTSREFTLLLHLMHHQDQAVSRAELLLHVHGQQPEAESNSVETLIFRIREKLGDKAWMVETVRGVGYRLRSRRERA